MSIWIQLHINQLIDLMLLLKYPVSVVKISDLLIPFAYDIL